MSEQAITGIVSAVVTIGYGAIRAYRKGQAKPGETVEAGYTTTEFMGMVMTQLTLLLNLFKPHA